MIIKWDTRRIIFFPFATPFSLPFSPVTCSGCGLLSGPFWGTAAAPSRSLKIIWICQFGCYWCLSGVGFLLRGWPAGPYSLCRSSSRTSIALRMVFYPPFFFLPLKSLPSPSTICYSSLVPPRREWCALPESRMTRFMGLPFGFFFYKWWQKPLLFLFFPPAFACWSCRLFLSWQISISAMLSVKERKVSSFFAFFFLYVFSFPRAPVPSLCLPLQPFAIFDFAIWPFFASKNIFSYPLFFLSFSCSSTLWSPPSHPSPPSRSVSVANLFLLVLVPPLSTQHGRQIGIKMCAVYLSFDVPFHPTTLIFPPTLFTPTLTSFPPFPFLAEHYPRLRKTSDGQRFCPLNSEPLPLSSWFFGEPFPFPASGLPYLGRSCDDKLSPHSSKNCERISSPTLHSTQRLYSRRKIFPFSSHFKLNFDQPKWQPAILIFSSFLIITFYD